MGKPAAAKSFAGNAAIGPPAIIMMERSTSIGNAKIDKKTDQ
jgi:hypothetical protein